MISEEVAQAFGGFGGIALQTAVYDYGPYRPRKLHEPIVKALMESFAAEGLDSRRRGAAGGNPVEQPRDDGQQG